MTFSTLVDKRAAENPAGPAVADSTTSLTNAGLLARVQAVAVQLADLGITSGDVVALRLTNRVEFVVAFVHARMGDTDDVPALKARCREQLTGYKRPAAIHALEVLPSSAVGKLDRRSLRDGLTHA